jgi:hypothetical protein
MPEVPTSDEERFIMPDTVDPKERNSLPEGVTGEQVLRKLLGVEEPDTTGDTGVEGGVDVPNEDTEGDPEAPDEPEDVEESET